METLIPLSQLKQASIGQSLVKSTRPNSVIAPILFSLGIDTDHVFGSKWLVCLLYRLGYSISDDEVTRYKQSVVANENVQTHVVNSF